MRQKRIGRRNDYFRMKVRKSQDYFWHPKFEDIFKKKEKVHQMKTREGETSWG